eukprot:1154925-Pelagomonas_calceolata.AAC.8
MHECTGSTWMHDAQAHWKRAGAKCTGALTARRCMMHECTGSTWMHDAQAHWKRAGARCISALTAQGYKAYRYKMLKRTESRP